MENEEASPLVDGAGGVTPPSLRGVPRTGSRSRQAVLERRKLRAATPPRVDDGAKQLGGAAQTQPDQMSATTRPLPPLEALKERRAGTPPRASASRRHLSPTPPQINAGTEKPPQGTVDAKKPPEANTGATKNRADATSEQSAKVTDEMLIASINRIPSIPPTAKEKHNAKHLVSVLRHHLKWVQQPPKKYRVLFQQGDESNDEMFFIVKGALEVLEGTEVKGVLEEGRSLGEICIGNPDAGQRTATIRAQSDDVELLTLNTEAFRQALHAVHATFVGSGVPVEPEEPLRDDEWDWCLSFGCMPGQRKLPSSVATLGQSFAAIGGETPPQPVTLQLPCSWKQWPGDGFTLPDSCVFKGTGTVSLCSENWCELKGAGTRFLTEIQPKDTIVVQLADDDTPLGIDANANGLAHTFTVLAVVDDQTVQVTHPVKAGLNVPHVEYQVRRTVDTWGEAEWKAQGDWEALPFEERSRGRTDAATNTCIEVKLLDDDPFFRLMDTYMHRPWLCPLHTLKLGFLKAGLEVRERISNQYDVLFLMVRARDDVLEKTADAMRAEAELHKEAPGGFLRNLLVDDPTIANGNVSKEQNVVGDDWGENSDSTSSQDAGHGDRRIKYSFSHGHSSIGSVSARPDASDYGSKWGHVLGMIQYDSQLKDKFEDRRLNTDLFACTREVSENKFPHPRYFHSGERQVLVRAVMESVEWARYVPHQRRRNDSRGGDACSENEKNTLSYSVYSKVQIAKKNGAPAAKLESTQQSSQHFTLCDTVAFGAPVKVGESSLSRRPLESPLWTTLRDSKGTPLHDVLPAHQDDDEMSATTCTLPSFTETITEQWGPLSRGPGRHELLMYPFRIQEVQKIDLTQRRDRREDKDAEFGDVPQEYRRGLHVHKLPKGLELFVLERNKGHEEDDTYYMHYLHRGQNYKDFIDKVHSDHRDVAGELEFYRTDSIREEMTLLLDCQALHCSYEHEFLQSAWADRRNIFSPECLNLPLNRIEGYFGSEVAFYFAWIQCYTKMLAYPAFLGLILQLIVWWPPTPFPGSVTKLRGWIAAYCLFVGLWSSMFVVKWNRLQSELQHRWGLRQTNESESLRKEWLDRTVPADESSDDASVPLSFVGKLKQTWKYRDYAHVKQSVTGSTLDSARYSSKGMHAARLSCSCCLVMVSACVVILFSLSALVIRTRGTNTIAGSVSAWTTVEFQDVSIEFWTIYEEQCDGLIPTPCDEKTWIDNINTCGECKVLVANFVTKYGGLCDNFCNAQGLRCAGVWDEIGDTCELKPDSEVLGAPLSCSVPYLDSSDAICECLPPEGGQLASDATCDRPDQADFRPENAVYGFPPTSNSTAAGGGIQYSWRHSKQAVVRSPALCDEQREDCSVETLDAVGVLDQSELLQNVPAAKVVVPLMLNVDNPHSSLPLRMPVYEPSCSELSTWVNLSRAHGLSSNLGDMAVGLIRQPFGLPTGAVENEENLASSTTGAVRKAEWSVANINVVTSMYMFMDDSATTSANVAGSDFGGCSIQMERAMSNVVVADTSSGAGAVALDTTANIALYFRPPDPSLGQLLVYASTALSVAFIGLFGIAWKTVARWMNDWENHRTAHEYEDAYVFKQYVFQFINFYFMLVYIAYLKQGTPIMSYSIEQYFGWELDEVVKQDVLRLEDDSIPTVEMKEACVANPDSDNSEPDCMYELFSQLFFLFVAKQFALEAWENISPKLKQKGATITQGKNTPEIILANSKPDDSVADSPPAETGSSDERSEDFCVDKCYHEFTMAPFGDKDINGCLNDYNEMMIQFGFMTLFAAAFPGGAFFALLNNLNEMRSDGDALLNDFQRPPVSRRGDIGAWNSVMNTISYLAVISNSFIIGFTSAAAFELLVDDGEESSTIEERYTRYELWAAVIVAEHLMLLGKLGIEASFSRVPNRVKRAEIELRHHEAALHDEKKAKLARDGAAAK